MTKHLLFSFVLLSPFSLHAMQKSTVDKTAGATAAGYHMYQTLKPMECIMQYNPYSNMFHIAAATIFVAQKGYQYYTKGNTCSK